MDPLLWLGILAVLLIIEAATVGLVTVWFVGGALAAALPGQAQVLSHSGCCFWQYPWYYCFLPDRLLSDI